MNQINRKIDDFCTRHPHFGIPNLMRILVIGNVIVYALYLLTGQNPDTIRFLSFNLSSVLDGELWRIVTFLFVPNNFNPFWLLISLYFYYVIGNVLEREWGTAKFNLYYFGGAIFTLIGTILLSLILGISVPLSGTYYISMSMFFAFAMLYPDATVLLLVIPIKVKWLALLDAAMFAVEIIVSLIAMQPLNVLLPLIALLNFVLFFGGDLLALLRRVTGRTAHQASPNTIHFKKAVKEQQKDKGYHHKCCVCGRTDTDFPNLEFRYCSKCAGYRCYCADHIGNHVHITDENQ